MRVTASLNRNHASMQVSKKVYKGDLDVSLNHA
jgi:hypothetical protein